MRNILWTATLLLVGACGAATTQTTAGPPPAQASGREASRWATRAECEQLVDHLQKIVFLDRQVSPGHPRYDAFMAQEQDPQWWQSHVDQCTITVTKGDYDCLMRANDTRTADQCYRRETNY